MTKKRPLPPTYLFISIVTMVLLNFLAPNPIIAPYPWNLLGTIPLIAGIIFNLLADTQFKKAKTTVKPFEISSNLITTGVFRISRHPMYLGMVLMLFGIGTLLGSLVPLVVIVIFTVFMEFIFIRTEEEMLQKQFGMEWATYRNKVRKWI